MLRSGHVFARAPLSALSLALTFVSLCTFLVHTHAQVVRCRRVLALSYITRFFQYEVPHAEGKDQTDEQRQAREFFLFLQVSREDVLCVCVCVCVCMCTGALAH